MGAAGGSAPEAAPSIIPSQGDLLGDLLNLDMAPPTTSGPPPPSTGMQMGGMDLLGGGLDSLVGISHSVDPYAATPGQPVNPFWVKWSLQTVIVARGYGYYTPPLSFSPPNSSLLFLTECFPLFI